MREYQHGGDIVGFAKMIGCEVDEVIDLSSNINFVKPKIDIDFNSLDISAYPNYDKLQEAMSHLYNIEKDEIELFNGATTAIHSLLRFLKLNHCTLYAPIYLEYKKSAYLHNYDVELINRLENIEQEPKEESLVIFVNPSTPDGKYYDIDKVMQKWIEKRCTILIDESFLDFTPYPSAIKYLKKYDRLYILKSMTKFYSSAGIRVGVILSNKQNITMIKKQEPLWKISQFDSHYLQSALRDNSFIKKSQTINDRHREYLIEILEKSPYIEKIYPSSANFILVKLKNIDAKSFQDKLTPYKIMVRNCSNFDFLDESFVRIAVKDINILKVMEGIV
jgi:threonine-phosphate decarboxylase